MKATVNIAFLIISNSSVINQCTIVQEGKKIICEWVYICSKYFLISLQLQQDKKRLREEGERAEREGGELRQEVELLRGRLEETEWGLCQKSGELALLKSQLKETQVGYFRDFKGTGAPIKYNKNVRAHILKTN